MHSGINLGDDFTIFKQLFPYDMTCCFEDVVIDVKIWPRLDFPAKVKTKTRLRIVTHDIYIRNQMVYPWNEKIISLAIFNFGKKKNKQKNKR